MTNSTLPRSRVLTRTALTVAALAAVSCARGDPAVTQLASAVSLPTPAVALTEKPQCTETEPRQTLSLVNPAGVPLQLNYFRDCGWMYARGGQSERRAAPRQAAFAGKMASRAQDPSAAVGEDPLALFVDGPTGYTFAWTRDGGWKFVGHIAGK